MKRILVLTALAATMAVAAIASPAGAGLVLTDLTVAPDIGRPGDAFTVSGGGCERLAPTDESAAGRSIGGRFAPRGNGPSQNFSVSVMVAFPTPTATTTTPNTNGDWSVGFVVPAGTPAGVYEVAATCMFNPTKQVMGRGIPQVPVPYISSTYTVVGDPAAPAAAPVPGAPRFTG